MNFTWVGVLAQQDGEVAGDPVVGGIAAIVSLAIVIVAAIGTVG